MSFYRRSQALIQTLAKGPSIARSSHFTRALRTAAAAAASQHFGLTEDQLEFKAVADDFAAKELLPFAAKWDAEKYFPVNTLKNAAELGFGGILVAEDVGEALDRKVHFGVVVICQLQAKQYANHVGGSSLGRTDAAVIFEALAYGDISVTAYLTIHNMVASCIDK